MRIKTKRNLNFSNTVNDASVNDSPKPNGACNQVENLEAALFDLSKDDNVLTQILPVENVDPNLGGIPAHDSSILLQPTDNISASSTEPKSCNTNSFKLLGTSHLDSNNLNIRVKSSPFQQSNDNISASSTEPKSCSTNGFKLLGTSHLDSNNLNICDKSSPFQQSNDNISASSTKPKSCSTNGFKLLGTSHLDSNNLNVHIKSFPVQQPEKLSLIQSKSKGATSSHSSNSKKSVITPEVNHNADSAVSPTSFQCFEANISVRTDPSTPKTSTPLQAKEDGKNVSTAYLSNSKTHKSAKTPNCDDDSGSYVNPSPNPQIQNNTSVQSVPKEPIAFISCPVKENEKTSTSVLHQVPKTPFVDGNTDSSIDSSGQVTTPVASAFGQRTRDNDPFSYTNVLSREWLESILKSSLEGKLVLRSYQDKGFLLSRKRTVLVRKIIDYELRHEPKKKILPERFMELARAICRLFPSEKEEVYYVPRTRDRLNKVHKAKGKLYDRWINTRRLIIADTADNENDSANMDEISSSLGINTNEEAQENVNTSDMNWCKNNKGPVSIALSPFEKTCFTRLNLFFKEGGKDIANYLNRYPALAEEEGFLLIDQDFDKVFPGKGDSLLAKWQPVFSSKILNHAKRILPSRKDLELNLRSLKIDIHESDDAIQIVNTLFLLPLLLPSLTVRKNWKPTKLEAKDGFFLYAETHQEAQEQLNRRSARFAKYKLPDQPTAVLVGPLMSPKFYVVLKDIIYCCGSALKSIDVCFKLFMLLRVGMPPDSPLSWEFLKCYVYEIESETAKYFPSLVALENDLRL